MFSLKRDSEEQTAVRERGLEHLNIFTYQKMPDATRVYSDSSVESRLL